MATITQFDVAIPDGKVILLLDLTGGKSTLLKARLLSIQEGKINLDKSIHATSTKEIAKINTILPQSPESQMDLL